MKDYPTENIRNVALLSHGGCGKTTFVDHALYLTGLLDKAGDTTTGNTVCDYEPEEVKRKMSITLSLAPLEWKDHKINILDTPGYSDFYGEVVAASAAAEGAILFVSATGSVEVGTLKAWNLLREKNVPTLIYINRLDTENANFEKTLNDIQEKLSERSFALMLPASEGASYRETVDILKMKIIFAADTAQKTLKEEDIPDNLKQKAQIFKEKAIEIAAEGNDELLTKYLEGEKLSDEEIMGGLKSGIAGAAIFPVLCGSLKLGPSFVLDAIVSLLPSPVFREALEGKDPKTNQPAKRKVSANEPFSAQVFKTSADPYVGKITYFKVFSGTFAPDSGLYNATKGRPERVSQVLLMRGKQQEPVNRVVAGDIGVVTKLAETTTQDALSDKDKPIVFPSITFPRPVYTVAVEPKSRGDEEKLIASLGKMLEEDPTFRIERNPELRQILVSGMGDLHLDVILERLTRKFGVAVTTGVPKIPYRETIGASSEAQGKYKKQSGGRGQYGDVWLRLTPLEKGKGFEFVDKIVGGAIPRNYIPAVEKGLRSSLLEGILAGFPVVDLRITLFDGTYHEVDSSDIAFQIAASMGFKKACEAARPVLLEPIYKVSVTVPQEFMGDIIGDLNSRRGRVMGTDQDAGNTTVSATVPLSEMLKYAIDLRSMTQGRGTFEMDFLHYEEVPAHLAEKIIHAAKREKEEAKDK